MPSKCIAPGCINYTSSRKASASGSFSSYSTHNKENGIAFHRFPKDNGIRKRWEAAIITARVRPADLGKPAWTATSSTVICSEHFLSKDYESNGWTVLRKLRKGAAPTIFEYAVPNQNENNSTNSTILSPSTILPEAQIDENKQSTSKDHGEQRRQGDSRTCGAQSTDSPQKKKPRTSAFATSENVIQESWFSQNTSGSRCEIQDEEMPLYDCTIIENSCGTSSGNYQLIPNSCSTPISIGAEGTASRKRCHRSLFINTVVQNSDTKTDYVSLETNIVSEPSLLENTASDSEYLPLEATLPDEDDTPRKIKLKLLLSRCHKINEELQSHLSFKTAENKMLTNKNNTAVEENINLIKINENKEEINKQLEEELKKIQREKLEESKKKESQSLSNKQLKKKIKTLQKKVQRLRTHQECIDHLAENGLISNDAMKMLEKTITPGAASMLQRVKTDTTSKRELGNKVPIELRAFSLTLYFYSPKAYNYIRSSFNKALPHPKTLQGWMSHVSAGPGFTQEALNAITIRVEEAKKRGRKVKLAVSQDDISLKEGVHFDGHRISGYVDMGPDEDGNITIATEEKKANHACVFMAVCINDFWKMPVGYFLVQSLTGPDRAILSKECILKLEATGAEVECLTFDGTACNWSMAKELGAKLTDLSSMVPSFPNPADPARRVNAMLDACHMVKLVRNCLAEKKIFYDGNKRPIEWVYLEELHKLQTEEGLKLANKLARKHIDWRRCKMKVRVAVQTFSSSVADALEYCKNVLELPQFDGVQATVDFIRKIDKLFDILNSSSPFATHWKAPLKSENIAERREFLNDTVEYIKNITTSKIGGLMINSDRKTGFLGLIVGAKCVLDLYDRLIDGTTMTYLLTYKFSQDHLEMFFSLIRQRGGWNNNPMCHQFQSAYKSLLLHNEIKHVATGNCTSQNLLKLLSVTSKQKIAQEPSFDCHVPEGPLERFRFREEDGDNHSLLVHEHNQHEYAMSDFNILSRYCEDVVEYVAGFVVKSLTKSIPCQRCRESLLPDPEDINNSYSLINFKDRGGLVIPSRDVVKLCKFTEQCFRQSESENLNSVLAMKIPRRVVLYAREHELFLNLTSHINSLGPFNNHYMELVCSIASQYLKVRLHHRAREINAAKDDIRSDYNRLVINKHM